ncbi:MAG TPA: GMC oxidoreductase, partial [Chloroflexota bacterium]
AADQLPPQVANGWEVAYEPDWGFTTEPDASGRSINAWRGRLVGGCSAVNAAIALRGHPRDYDGWVELGNPGWSFDEILPYFRRLESDADFHTPYHNGEGPLPVRRYGPDELTPLNAAFLDAAQALGCARVEDHNQPGAVGVGLLPTNTRRDGLRMSCALTYLAAARSRPNLEVRPDTLVDRVLLTDGRCGGVVTAAGEIIEADLVLVAAGAYCSPAILLRSGIGPADELRSLGIVTNHDLPGVGRGLIDHAINSIDLPASPPLSSGPKYQTMLTARSSLADAEGPPDLHVFPAGPFGADGYSPTGVVQAIVFSVVKPRSEGWVRLRSADPADAPRINLGLLEDADDLARMIEALELARTLARQPALAARIVGPELAPGDATDLASVLRSRVETYHHPVRTCRMGPDPRRGAVVDAHARVHGIDALRVVDASIMPDIPSVNTNVPTIMLAERLADLIRHTSS